MKIGKKVFTAVFAIGLGSSCAYAQTASTAAQTVTGTSTTFTAVVAQVNTTAGTISLTQPWSAKPIAAHDSPTVTADYPVSPTLLKKLAVGATVQVQVERINGIPAVIALNGVVAMPQVAPGATPSSTSTLTPSLASNPAVSNPARLTPVGIE